VKTITDEVDVLLDESLIEGKHEHPIEAPIRMWEAVG
jgi:hypothetical protein